LQNKDITVYGDGSQTRSFCYVDDLIEGMIRLMDAPDEVIGPMNLGNPTEFTIGELAERILQMTESHAAIVYLPLPQDDPRQRKPDIDLARRVLGWEPRIGLEEGLKRTIAHFRSVVG